MVQGQGLRGASPAHRSRSAGKWQQRRSPGKGRKEILCSLNYSGRAFPVTSWGGCELTGTGTVRNVNEGDKVSLQ